MVSRLVFVGLVYPVVEFLRNYNMVDGCEILHQLMGGKHPIIYRVSTIPNWCFIGLCWPIHSISLTSYRSYPLVNFHITMENPPIF